MNFLSSSIGKKVIMSLSGLFLIVFVTLHACLNLTALCSRDCYDLACEFMGSNPLVQAMVPVLVAGFAIHILFSIWIEFKNLACRPREMRYAVANNTKCDWSAKNMFVLGIIVVGLLCIHLFHFWSKMQFQSWIHGEEANAYDLLTNLFSSWFWCVFYVVWVTALFFHLTHGFWSAFQTLGISNSNWLPRLKAIAKIYAIVLWFAYISIPVCTKLFLQGN